MTTFVHDVTPKFVKIVFEVIFYIWQLENLFIAFILIKILYEMIEFG